jgi:hypothetical protein
MGSGTRIGNQPLPGNGVCQQSLQFCDFPWEILFGLHLVAP